MFCNVILDAFGDLAISCSVIEFWFDVTVLPCTMLNDVIMSDYYMPNASIGMDLTNIGPPHCNITHENVADNQLSIYWTPGAAPSTFQH